MQPLLKRSTLLGNHPNKVLCDGLRHVALPSRFNDNVIAQGVSYIRLEWVSLQRNLC